MAKIPQLMRIVFQVIQFFTGFHLPELFLSFVIDSSLIDLQPTPVPESETYNLDTVLVYDVASNCRCTGTADLGCS